MSKPLMPKATAVWLVENTSLTFEQISEFCDLHVLEVKGIADGDVAQGIKGKDPVASGELTRSEIDRCQANANARLMMAKSKYKVPEAKPRKGPRYTPVSRRQDRPDAIAWLLRYHPELPDSQIAKLVGTTKPTIQSVRDRSHWNSANIKPVDPVTLGLCSQLELDAVVAKAAEKAERERRKAGGGPTLLPAEETTAQIYRPEAPVEETPTFEASDEAGDGGYSDEEDYDPDQVFARLGDGSSDGDAEDEAEDSAAYAEAAAFDAEEHEEDPDAVFRKGEDHEDDIDRPEELSDGDNLETDK